MCAIVTNFRGCMLLKCTVHVQPQIDPNVSFVQFLVGSKIQ